MLYVLCSGIMHSRIFASAWHPRGELERFARLLPTLHELYDQIVISTPPDTSMALIEHMQPWERVQIQRTEQWITGRHTAVGMALDAGADWIHAVDFERMLRWLETHPHEVTSVIEQMQSCDVLVVGRTPAAYATHAQALIQTEAISNAVFSHVLGRKMDFSAGCRGFSRAAAAWILRNSPPVDAIGTDSEWIVLAQRGGFTIDYMEVDGLSWEVPDHHQATVSDEARQREIAQAYDADANNWRFRLDFAQRIVHAGLDALTRELGEH